MFAAIPPGRHRLSWHSFKEVGFGSWLLSVWPPLYADIFSEQEPEVMEKCADDWQPSRWGTSRTATLAALDATEIERVCTFLADYKRYLVLGGQVEGEQEEALDSCLALGYGHDDKGERTELGDLVYRAKYRKCRHSARELARLLAAAIWRVPGRLRDRPVCISYVPPSPEKGFDLPQYLAERLLRLVRSLPGLRKRRPLVHSRLEGHKPAAKALSYRSKATAWNLLYSEDAVRLSADVKGANVYVIDDVYQSGATIHSYAKFLKSREAAAVLGLVCTKTRGDTDNL